MLIMAECAEKLQENKKVGKACICNIRCEHHSSCLPGNYCHQAKLPAPDDF
jgi:hypothetical protein